MSYSAEGSRHSRQIEVPGVVMSSAGLIVTTSFAIDPEPSAADLQTKVVSVRIRPSGGTEVAGRIVLRDPDRGLVFIRPTTTLSNVTPIDFSKSVKVQTGDPIFTLGNLGRAGSRGQRVSVDRIVGVVEKPRLLFVLAPSIGAAFGNSAFNDQGEIIGLVTLKESRAGGEQNNSMNPFDMGMVIIVNGQDIAESAQQAPELKDVKEAASK